MKHILVTLGIFMLLGNANSQTKRLLMEEFTGTHCGNCPMGVYYIDSLKKIYPNLIAVSNHSFTPPYDSMNFSEIDTLFKAYAGGVPCAAIDRILWPGGKGSVTRLTDSWDTIVRNRFEDVPEMVISINPSWNENSREITVEAVIEVVSALPKADYRISLYVVEDSVTGTGSGYDQLNYYNTTKGNPFFGRGNPIIGYVHRHVARALLPSPWGVSGIIPDSPISGNTYQYTFHYTLPARFNEDRINLIGLVSRFSADHKNDEVFDAHEMKLLHNSSIDENKESKGLSFYLIFRKTTICLNPETMGSIESLSVFDVSGKLMDQTELISQFVNFPDLKPGFYIISLGLKTGEKISGKWFFSEQ